MSYQAERWADLQDLHRTPKAVLKQLAARANSRTLECYPSQETLAKDLGFSRRTVGSAIRYLEEQKFIERATRHHRSNGYRKTDLVTLLMETKQTVVQTWRSYSDYLEDTNPSRYAHRNPAGSNGNGEGGPMGTAAQANGNGVPDYEQEVEQEVEAGRSTSTSRSSTSTPSREASIRIAAVRVDSEWVMSIEGIDSSLDDNQPFKQVLGDVIEAGLNAGLTTDTLAFHLQDSWKVHDHWVIKVDDFEKRVARAVGTRTLLALPGRTA